MKLDFLLSQSSIPSTPVKNTYIRNLLHTNKETPLWESQRIFSHLALYGTHEYENDKLKAGLNLDEYVYFCAMFFLHRTSSNCSSTSIPDVKQWTATQITRGRNRMDAVRSQKENDELFDTLDNNHPYEQETLENRLERTFAFFPELEEEISFLSKIPAREYIDRESNFKYWSEVAKNPNLLTSLKTRLKLPRFPKYGKNKVRIPEKTRLQLQREKGILNQILTKARLNFDFPYTTVEKPITPVSSNPVCVLSEEQWIDLWKEKEFNFILFHFFSSGLFSQYDTQTKEHLCADLATRYTVPEIIHTLASFAFLKGNTSTIDSLLNLPLEQAISEVYNNASIEEIKPYFLPPQKVKKLDLANPRTIPVPNQSFNEEKIKQGLRAATVTPVSVAKFKEASIEMKGGMIAVKNYNPSISKLEQSIQKPLGTKTLRAVRPMFKDFLDEGRQGRLSR